MKQNDSELVRRTLEGDQQAFALLVEKYQEQIHTLAWQKIGDFHTAEEITQDAFVTAYQKLNSLKHPHRFSGWLYVITTNICNMWHRKKRPMPESLEQTDPMELEELYYTEYKDQEREEDRKENQRSLVRKLLSRLKESDRTVVTLHYLAGLSCEEIGKFLGVSTNTVKSRLHRARNRLRGEETLIQENLSSFQLPKHLSENIMQEISNLSPVVPSANKPVMPWIVSTASAIIVFMLIGIGAKQLIDFQRPYNIDADTEPTIEITDAKRVIDSPEKSTNRNLVEKPIIPKKDNKISQDSNSQLVDTAKLDKTTNAGKNDILQNGLVSLSGTVVDYGGKAIHGLELTIKPMKILKNGNMEELTPMSSWKKVVTDVQGGFSFNNIDPVASQLVLLSDAGSDYIISSLTIGELTIYNNGKHDAFPLEFGRMTFGIEPGMTLDNTVVTVQRPPRRIRGRILLRNGKPLANAVVDLTIHAGEHDKYLFFFPEFGGSIITTLAQTDFQGYFVHYLSNKIDRDYSVKVNYHGSTDKSGWFQLREGKWKDDLIFRVKDLQREKNKINKRVKAQQAVWTLNPYNGHAYKRIFVDSWDDAIAKAKTEEAYLVAINDESEQKWIESRFPEYLFYWIGLSSKQDGTFDQWTNGEQVTYVNWLSTKDSTKPNTPIVLDFFSKRWMSIDANNKFLPSIKHAIIEREDIKIKTRK